MRDDRNGHDLIEELERMDRFLDGTEAGDVPLEVLRARGIEMPDEKTLDDAEVHRVLWLVIEGMADLGMFIDSTDHLSDRDLYRYLAEALLVETVLTGSAGAEFISPIGSGSDEDNDIFLRYYADDADRKMWGDDGFTIPPHEPPPFDRDRLMPHHALEGQEDGGQPS